MGDMPDDRRAHQEPQKADGGDGGQGYAWYHFFGFSGNAVAKGNDGGGSEAHQQEAQRGAHEADHHARELPVAQLQRHVGDREADEHGHRARQAVVAVDDVEGVRQPVMASTAMNAAT